MPPDLTERQQALLAYFEQETAQTGKAPSLRQAALDLGVSHAAVAQTLKVLEKKGCIRREGRYSRTVHILNRLQKPAGMQRAREIPVIGRIAAGLPMYAQQEWEGTIVADGAVYRGENLFALRIRGDSMTGAGIFENDLVICEPRQYAQSGEIIAALVNNEEATVKRFFLRDGQIELRPENPDYRPVRYGFGQILIQGKVIGLFRSPEGIDHHVR